MKGQNILAILVAFGVILVMIGGIILASTIMNPNMLSIGLIIAGILIIGIGTRLG